MTTITIILVLISSFVAFDAPVPATIIDCNNPSATIDAIAQWLPPSYANFADLMANEGGSAASSAIVLLPCAGMAYDNGNVLVLAH